MGTPERERIEGLGQSVKDFPDPLTAPVGEVVKTPRGRLAAKETIAVITAARLVSNGVPREDVERVTNGILRSREPRKCLATTLERIREQTGAKNPPQSSS